MALAESPQRCQINFLGGCLGRRSFRAGRCAGSYPSSTAAIRTQGLRPHREPCQTVKGRDVSIIDHPPGEETQWDWIELPDPPAAWNAGKLANLLVGALSHSSR